MINFIQNRLSDDLKLEYDKKGYAILPKIIDNDNIEKLKIAFDRIFNNDYDRDIYPFDRVYKHGIDNPSLYKVNNGWWLNNDIRSAVLSPYLGYIMSFFMSTDEVRIWHDQVVLKKANKSSSENAINASNIGWHQDYAHWQVSSSQNMATLWLALQDTDLNNGGMRTIVGTHKWRLKENADTFHDKDLDKLKEKFKKDHDWVDEPCILKKGEATIHHCLSLHGSGANKTDEDRLSLIIHCMPKKTYYRGRIDPHKNFDLNSKGNRHANVPLLGPNAKPGTYFDNDYFPVIWPFKTDNSNLYDVNVESLKNELYG